MVILKFLKFHYDKLEKQNKNKKRDLQSKVIQIFHPYLKRKADYNALGRNARAQYSPYSEFGDLAGEVVRGLRPRGRA